MEEYSADFGFSIDDAEFSVYLRSGFYKSRGSRWKILHCHPNYELQLFEKGSFDFFLGNVSHHIEAPALMLISPNENHSFYSDSADASRICIEFSVKKKGEGKAFAEYNSLLRNMGKYKITRTAFSNTPSLRKIDPSLPIYEREALTKNEVSNALIEVFGILREAEKTENKSVNEKMRDNKRNELLADVLKYVEAHFSESITLDKVAAFHYVSPRQIERILRKELDENFLHLVNRCRIENIVREMLGGNEDYIALSSENGFSDYSTFWRNFKKITGQSPSEFLKKNRCFVHKK